MEDAATAEISRAQIWNWIRSPHGVLDSGENITPELFLKVLPEELEKIKLSLLIHLLKVNMIKLQNFQRINSF